MSKTGFSAKSNVKAGAPGDRPHGAPRRPHGPPRRRHGPWTPLEKQKSRTFNVRLFCFFVSSQRQNQVFVRPWIADWLRRAEFVLPIPTNPARLARVLFICYTEMMLTQNPNIAINPEMANSLPLLNMEMFGSPRISLADGQLLSVKSDRTLALLAILVRDTRQVYQRSEIINFFYS